MRLKKRDEEEGRDLVEEDLTAGESDIKKDISVDEALLSQTSCLIRHCLAEDLRQREKESLRLRTSGQKKGSVENEEAFYARREMLCSEINSYFYIYRVWILTPFL